MEPDLNIKRYLYAALRRWWLILLMGAGAATVAYFMTPTSSATFQSTATVLFDRKDDGIFSFASNGELVARSSLKTQSELVKSSQTLQLAASKVVGQSPDSQRADVSSEARRLVDNIKVTQLPGSNLLSITATAQVSEVAVMRSNAVAEAFIERTTEEQAKAISRGLDTVARQLRALQEVGQEQLIFEVEDLRLIGQELSATLDEVSKINNELFNLREAETGLISETESLSDFQASLDNIAVAVDRASSELTLVQGRMNLSAAELNELNLVYETEMESVAVSIGLIASQMETLVEVQDFPANEEGTASPARIAGLSSKFADSLDSAAKKLDELSLTESRIDPLQEAKRLLKEGDNFLGLSIGYINSAMEEARTNEGENRLQVSRRRIVELRNDLESTLFLVSRYRINPDAIGLESFSRDFIEQTNVLDVLLAVQEKELISVRELESDPLTDIYLLTAEGMIQKGSDVLVESIDQILSLEDPQAIEFNSQGSPDLVSQIYALSSISNQLAIDVEKLENLEDETVRENLLENFESLDTSIEVVARQIRRQLAVQTDSLVAGTLFIALDRIENGEADLSEVIRLLSTYGEDAVGTAGIQSEIGLIVSNLQDLSIIAFELSSRNLVADRVEPTSAGNTNPTQEIEELQAALRSVQRQIEDEYEDELDAKGFGILFVNAQRLGDNVASLGEIVTQLESLEIASSLDEEIGTLRSIASTIRRAESRIKNLGAADISSQELSNALELNTASTEISSASTLLNVVVTQMEQIRLGQGNVDIYSAMLAAEERVSSASLALDEANTTILRFGFTPEGNQWIKAASEEMLIALGNFDEAKGVLPFTDTNETAILSSPSLLTELSLSLGLISNSMEIVSRQLDRAQESETDPQLFAPLARLRNQVELARSSTNELAAQIGRAGQSVVADDSIYVQLLESQRQLQLTRLLTDSSSIRLANSAIAATKVIDRTAEKNAAIGGIAGFLLGIIATMLMDLTNRRIRSVDDMMQVAGARPLGAIPAAQGAWNPHPQVFTDSQTSPFSEAVRMIRANVSVSNGGKPAKVLLVTSPRVNEGKTTVALNLARTMAMEGKKVLIIDTNWHRPEVGSAFNLKDKEGLATALKNDRDPLDFLKQVDGVSVLPAGETLSNQSDILTSHALTTLLRRFDKRYDLVILDGPPIIGSADALVLAKTADAVLMVLRANKTSFKEASLGVQALEPARVKDIGVVLNMAPKRGLGALPYRDAGRWWHRNGKMN